MASWSTISFNFDPLAELVSPIESVLEVVQTVAAFLESLLDLLKIFAIDFSNPLRAIVALLLAAIRTILAQIRATGVQFLLVHPDFNRDGFDGIMQSVEGSYPAFETKVVGKFFDTGDIFRPQFPDGSSAAMLVFYFGADSPGDLIGFIRALLTFFGSNIPILTPPAPIELKVGPVTKSGASITQFKRLFDSDLDSSLVAEWKMPIPSRGLDAIGTINQLSSIVSSFTVPNFVLERSKFPGGQGILKRVDTPTQGISVNPRMEALSGLTVSNETSIREFVPGALNGPVYKHFEKRIDIPATNRIAGSVTGTYKFNDSESDLISGDVWYYRVRAYFGNLEKYLSTDIDSTEAFADDSQNSLLKQVNDFWRVEFGDDVSISPPSQTIVTTVPDTSAAESGFNAYNHVFQAVQAGLLLNFELPRPGRKSPDIARASRNRSRYTRSDQRTGWGTLQLVAGQTATIKAAFPKARTLRSSIFFKQLARRVTNIALVDIRAKPDLANLLANKWNANNVVQPSANQMNSTPDSVQAIVNKILNSSIDWGFVNLAGGSFLDPETGEFRDTVEKKISAYLALEDSLNTNADGQAVGDGPEEDTSTSRDLMSEIETEGADRDAAPPPPPIEEDTALTVIISSTTGPAPLTEFSKEEREALAEFLRIALIPLGGELGYLSWYGVTIGDLFPVFIPFIDDFFEFIKAILRALNSLVEELVDIIEALLQKVRLLEQILKSIIQILELLNITLQLSVLTFSGTNSSAADLANQLLISEDKPSASPFGLHSGLVLTAGGPGEGFLKAIESIKFILSLPLD